MSKQDRSVDLGESKRSEQEDGEDPDNFDVFSPAPSELSSNGERGADDYIRTSVA